MKLSISSSEQLTIINALKEMCRIHMLFISKENDVHCGVLAKICATLLASSFIGSYSSFRLLTGRRICVGGT